MKAVLLGVGQAGGKLTTALAEFDADAGYGAVLDALAVNTAAADLDPLPPGSRGSTGTASAATTNSAPK